MCLIVYLCRAFSWRHFDMKYFAIIKKFLLQTNLTDTESRHVFCRILHTNSVWQMQVSNHFLPFAPKGSFVRARVLCCQENSCLWKGATVKKEAIREKRLWAERSFEFCTKKSISISNVGRQPEASRARARVGGKETA